MRYYLTAIPLLPLLAIAMVSAFPEGGTAYAQTAPPAGNLIGLNIPPAA